MYLIDTDILIYALKGHEGVTQAFRDHADQPMALSVISYGELIFGAQKSTQRQRNLARVRRLAQIYPVIEVSTPVMDTYGELKATLQRDGAPLDDMDLIIGATALVLSYVLVSNNERHFRRIPDLRLENWVTRERDSR